MPSKIKLSFLGTGSAIPTAKRNHPAVLLTWKDENILFDCGEGTQRQFRKMKINPCKITRICISHWHADHVLGLPGLLQTLGMSGYNKTLKIYIPKGTRKLLDLYLKMFIRKDWNFKFKVNEVSKGKFVNEKEFFLEAGEMKHDTPTLGYSFVVKDKKRLDKKKLEKLKLPEKSPLIGELAQGKKIKFKGKTIDGKKLLYEEKGEKVSYVVDTVNNKNIPKLIKNSDLMVCESTYSADEQEIAKDHLHMTSKQVGKIAKKGKIGKLFLIHLSQRYDDGKGEEKILSESRKEFKETNIASDGDVVEV
ncbi:MAG: ribonuclease Z [Nanoarchaeota archaeon]